MTSRTVQGWKELLTELRAVLQADDGGGDRQWQAIGVLLNRIAATPDSLSGLARAGRLLERADLGSASVSAHGQLAAGPEQVLVTITGTGTLGEFSPALIAQCARHGLLARPTLTDFGGYRRCLLDPPAGDDLTLCVLDSSLIAEQLPSPWRIEDAEQVLASTAAELTELVSGYLRQSSATLVLNTVPLPAELSRQLVDLRSRARLAIAWRALDSAILQLALDHDRVVAIDVNSLVALGGPVADSRMALYAKVNLGPELLGRFAQDVAHLARAMRGRTKKVLVLDLDGTMWDGILAEDGPAGIEPASTLRGEAFERFQRVVRQLAAQGILLAVSSKNDHETVLSVLNEHPDMTLRAADFAAIEANWDPKPAALRRIAECTGLDCSSFVFIDDSPAECGAVTALLPEVAVIEVDGEPALHVASLLADGWFDVRILTEDDLERSSHYRRKPERDRLRAAATSTADYLRELAVEVRLAPAAEHELARISQLTQRTNQFNLITERLQPDEVREAAADPNQLVLAVHSSDRFGDDGLVGAVFATLSGPELVLRNVILSCRVFERGIEQAVISSLLGYAKQMGLTTVRAHYRPSSKNARFAELYPSLGFQSLGDDGGTRCFRHDLAVIAAPPALLRLVFEQNGLLCG